MNIYLDQEFIEHFAELRSGKKIHTIELISLGLYAEDGKAYYNLSKEYNYHAADGWVKDNVVYPIYDQTVSGDARARYDVSDFHLFYGKSLAGIREDIIEFVKPYGTDIQFWGYFADYDWVLFCSLFGRMIDLPKGWPMYCRDLKQLMDEKATELLHNTQVAEEVMLRGTTAVPSKFLLEDAVDFIKSNKAYPVNENEHNALADARWNAQLHNFLKRYPHV